MATLPRRAVTALAPPGLVTLGAVLPVDIPTTTAALCYVLAVVVATATGGLVAGLVASVASFLALNFFFTPPFHTFAVEETADLVALAVFLAVSVTVGTMFSRALEQRARAERREREARLLNHLGNAPPFRRADGGGAPEPRPVDRRALRPRPMRDHQ